MKKIIILLAILFQVNVMMANHGGNRLIRMQQQQERTIRAAYNKHKVTHHEYVKLMQEQRVIKKYIRAANADHYWNIAEIKRVEGKLNRAAARIRRYKTNWEV